MKDFKVVVMGDFCVGKSSILDRFLTNEFRNKTSCTIGATFHVKTINNTIRLNIWDTAGQERFQSMMPMYYRGAHAILLIYDVKSLHSYNRASKLIDEVCANPSPDAYPFIFLVGNKADIPNEDKEVSNQQSQSHAFQNHIIAMEVSAKTGYNIDELFSKVTDCLLKSQIFENNPIVITEKPNRCCLI